MPRVPQFDREVGYNSTPLRMDNYNLDGNMFGQANAQALGNLGEGLDIVAKASLKIRDTLEETKLTEFNNSLEQWKQDNMFAKESGYLNKQGIDAAGKSEDVLKSYDDFVTEWKNSNKVSNSNIGRIEQIALAKRSWVQHSATAHDLKQTEIYSSTQGKIGIDNAIKNAVAERYNPDGIKAQIANVQKLAQWQGNLNGADSTTIEAMQKDGVSGLLCAVLDTKLQEGDLSAKDFFEEYKEQIHSNYHAKYIGQIKAQEDKYLAKNLADEIFNSSESEEDSRNKLKAKEKELTIEQFDATQSRLDANWARKRKAEKQYQDDLMTSNYEVIDNKLANGELVSNEDLNYEGLTPQNRMALRNYVNEISKAGDVQTRDYIYDDLYQQSINDAQNFKNLNLAQYRPYLSASDYKAFQKRQQEIQNFTPTQLQDDAKIIKDAIEMYDLTGKIGKRKGDVDQAFVNSASAYVREYELKHGKRLTGAELNAVVLDFAKTFSYENPAEKTKLYELYAQGMNTKVGFTRDVLSDWELAKKQKGRDLTPEEKYEIVQNRLTITESANNNELSRALAPIKEGDIWNGHRITSLFGQRNQPTKGASTNHLGIDLAYNMNEPFTAYASGVVVNVSKDDDLGNFVDIKSPDGTIHRYGHANKITAIKGQQVNAGQIIGIAGSTGKSTGPHVHYAKLVNNKFVNPLGPRGEVDTSNKGWAF